MPGHGEKLSRKHEQALTALLTCPSITAAASQCGVDEATMRRWLKRDAFQSSYLAARRQVVHQAIAQIQQGCSDAVETLREVMKDPLALASARVSAARCVFDIAIKAVELEDLESRIVALETGSKEGV